LADKVHKPALWSVRNTH